MLGYHGCDRRIGERLLDGEPFEPSQNDYDWLGPGVYFWEANPHRGLAFARENARRGQSSIQQPFVVGAVIDLALCLDLTTDAGVMSVKAAYEQLVETMQAAGTDLPQNDGDRLRRRLDCAVIRWVHILRDGSGLADADSVRGAFIEGTPLYPESGFYDKTHVQIAVRNPMCIKAVFRVPAEHLRQEVVAAAADA